MNQQIPYSSQGITDLGLFVADVQHGIRPSIKPDCPQPYIQLMTACWATDAHTRPTFAQIHSTVFP